MSSAEVERFVRDLNNAWIEGRCDDLVPLFHDQVVMVPPGTGQRIVGRDAMVDSYRQFLAAAKVHEFRTLDLRADVFGGTAVAALRFEIRYEMQGRVYQERGTDFMVLHRDDSAWQVVWRTQVAEPGT